MHTDHLKDKSHVTLELGAVYAPFYGAPKYVLKRMNEAHGICTLVPVHGSFLRYESITELKRWTKVGIPEKNP